MNYTQAADEFRLELKDALTTRFTSLRAAAQEVGFDYMTLQRIVKSRACSPEELDTLTHRLPEERQRTVWRLYLESYRGFVGKGVVTVETISDYSTSTRLHDAADSRTQWVDHETELAVKVQELTKPERKDLIKILDMAARSPKNRARYLSLILKELTHLLSNQQ